MIASSALSVIPVLFSEVESVFMPAVFLRYSRWLQWMSGINKLDSHELSCSIFAICKNQENNYLIETEMLKLKCVIHALL